MKLFDEVVCPVSFTQIDNNISRITVFFNMLLIALYLFTGSPLFMWLVAIDYGIRALWAPRYSPLRWAAIQVGNLARIPQQMIDAAQKIFAARVGFLFAIVSVLLFPVSATASTLVATVLLIFTFLDSVVGICFGCLVYNYIVLPFYRARGLR